MKESVYKSFVSGDPHEEELLRQLIRGDIAGYEVLFHKYYPTFFAFIKGMTKETVVAEDITQNIFMKVWLNRERLDAAKSIRNYLFVLAKHEIYNYFRTKSRTFTTLKEAIAQAESKGGGIQPPRNEIEEKLDLAETAEQVETIVGKMPAGCGGWVCSPPAAAADFPHVAFRAHAEPGDRRTAEPVGTHRGQAS